jgi:oligoendopeptidase F
MQNAVKQDHKFIAKIKEFLSAGTSNSPKDIFAQMGIDTQDEHFWAKGLDEIELLLNETEALAQELKKF